MAAKVMIRARQKRHLRNLIRRFPELVKTKIAHSDDTDYRYRIIVSKLLWRKVVGAMVTEQTWSDFKSEAHRHLGDAYSDYTRALGAVWSEMHRLQQREPLRLTEEELAGVRDFCLVRLRQMEAASDYADRIALGRAFRTWQDHFGLPQGAADLAWRIAEYWRDHAEDAARLRVPEEYREFLEEC
ncbi:MAG: hypothetical protein JNL62_18895 [Bryobacterales bacterium]|nr:hypothetical protein [Bryobacterales bacterium]